MLSGMVNCSDPDDDSKLANDLKNSAPRVSIVILNYNGIDHLGVALKSVSSTRYANKSIILVDNGSTDGSVEFVRKNFPGVEIIELGKNMGSAKGWNVGIKASSAKYIALLNNDIEVDSNWLQPLVDFVEKNPSVAATDSTYLDYHRRDHYDMVAAGGRLIDQLGNVYAIDAGKYVRTRSTEPKRVFLALTLFRKEALDRSGLFDEDFFFAYDEADLCWRLNLMGRKIYSIPESVIYHKCSATAGKGGERKKGFYALEVRNRLLMVFKNCSALSLPWRLLFVLFEYLVMMSYWLVRGNIDYLKELAEGILWFANVNHLALLKKKRQTAQRLREVPYSRLKYQMIPYCGILTHILRLRKREGVD